MADFSVSVIRITKVEDHPNADRLSLIYFNDYAVISAKLDDGSHRYQVGDLVAYVPEASIVPEYLLKQGFWDEKNNRGMLAGSNYNRVKAIKLRGIISQGIMFPVKGNLIENELTCSILYVNEGDDISVFMGITKYEPPVPIKLQGEVANLFGYSLNFDVENIKAYPDIFEEGEPVEFSEKFHGTFCGVSIVPDLFHSEMYETNTLVYSKGLGSKGLIFKDNETNAENVYLRTIKRLGIRDKILSIYPNLQITLLGEIYGKGIQDLHYDTKEAEFAIFDIYVGEPGKGVYMDRVQFEKAALDMDIPTVPILYQGGYSKEIMEMYTSGKTVRNKVHMREGIVIRPMENRYHPKIGRVMLKSVSDEYLLRKNATEFN